MAHKTGFTSQNLNQKLQEANFARVEVIRTEFELVAFGYKSEIGDRKMGKWGDREIGG
jgi:hypothetical protein